MGVAEEPMEVQEETVYFMLLKDTKIRYACETQLLKLGLGHLIETQHIMIVGEILPAYPCVSFFTSIFCKNLNYPLILFF